jgi:hypothetical protein
MSNLELRKKIGRIFANRTHKFPDKKVEIIQTPETQNQRFIIAPYDITVDKIARLLVAERQKTNIEAAAKLLQTFHNNGSLSDAVYADMMTTVSSWNLKLEGRLGK